MRKPNTDFHVCPDGRFLSSDTPTSVFWNLSVLLTLTDFNFLAYLCESPRSPPVLLLQDGGAHIHRTPPFTPSLALSPVT